MKFEELNEGDGFHIAGDRWMTLWVKQTNRSDGHNATHCRGRRRMTLAPDAEVSFSHSANPTDGIDIVTALDR